MKKIAFFLAALLGLTIFSSMESTAQTMYEIPESMDLFLGEGEPESGIVPNMSYSALKQIYSPRDYEPALSDRYNPTLNGLASFFVPGLGQMLSNQNRRGINFFATGFTLATAATTTGVLGYVYGVPALAYTSLITSVGALAIQISSCVDAIKVSKVMNMYERDLKKQNIIRFNLRPSVEMMTLSSGHTFVPGMTLAVNF